MTRPKEYELDEVIDKATNLFWEKGFEGSSISEIVSVTGLNKHSIYREFNDKEGLFLSCIDNYAFNITKPSAELLTKKPLGLANIIAFFNNRIEYASSEDCKGCLLVNSIIEKELLSEEVNLKVKSHLSYFTALFYNCLVESQKNEEISIDNDCETLAEYISCFNNGLLNVGKNGLDKVRLRKIVSLSLSVIKK